MRVTFDRDTREEAKKKDNYLIGVRVTSPHSHKGNDLRLQTPAFDKEQADVLGAFLIHLLHGKKTPQEAFKLSFGSPNNKHIEWKQK